MDFLFTARGRQDTGRDRFRFQYARNWDRETAQVKIYSRELSRTGTVAAGRIAFVGMPVGRPATSADAGQVLHLHVHDVVIGRDQAVAHLHHLLEGDVRLR